MRFLPYLFLVVNYVSAEVITLSTEKNITCVVSGSDTTSTVYINPSIKSGFIKRSTELNNWIKNDWTSKSSLNSNLGVVTDKRWQDFEIFEDIIGHALTEHYSLPISLCVHQKISIHVLSKNYWYESFLNFTDNQIGRASDHCRWFHYTLKKQNNDLLLYSDETIIQRFQLNFNPYWIYFHNQEQSIKTLWKLHNYDFQEAKNSTKANEEKSVLSVNFTDNLCLSMYVSIDENSFLDISLDVDGDVNSTLIIGFNKKKGPKKWKRIDIRTKKSGLGKLSFYRGLKEEKGQNGYWAIDNINFCSKDIEIYQALIDVPGDYTCEVLDKPKNQQNALKCTTPGYFGENCSISCSSVLGPNFAYCQKHKICQDASSCFCSWGYQGENCDQKCDPGKWNMFCMNKCKSECPQSCDVSTGECLTTTKKLLRSIADIKRQSEIPPPKLTESDLPTKVTSVSNKINIDFPVSKTNNGISYSFEYFCVNRWCKSQDIKEDNILLSHSPLVYIIENFTPFTDYKVRVKAQLFNQTLEKTYTVDKTDSIFSPNNLSIYYSSFSSLRLRFAKNTSVDFSLYKVWYYEVDSQFSPNYTTGFFSCQLWDDFVCAQIDNLKNGTRYSLIIQEDGNEGQINGVSKTFQGVTSKREFENLRIVEASNYKAKIAWNYPSVSNNSLQNYVVEVKNETNTNKFIVKDYQLEFSINYNSKYVISVGNSEVQKNEISATFAPINPTFSSKKDVLIETCSTVCYWLIPKPRQPKNCNYKIQVKPDVTTDLKNRTKHTIFVSQDNDYNEYFRVDLWSDAKSSDRLSGSEEYSWYLEMCDGSSDLITIPKRSPNNTSDLITIPKRSANNILIAFSFIFFMLFLLGALLVLLLYRKIRHRHQNDVIQEEKNDLISKDQKFGNETKFTNIESRRFETYLKHAVLNGKELINQFRAFPFVTKAMVHANQEKNRNKNKNNNNVPYDHNRVILKHLDGLGTEDYINASYIDGFTSPKTYIAAQGPKFYTVRDFWRMIWQELIETIVMATNFIENRKRKCAEYFPQSVGAIFECGEMFIKLNNEEVYEHHHVRYFEVSYRQQTRRIQHIVLTWKPENSNPLYSTCIVPLVKKICAIRENSNTPILVHCSSGMKRTGILILCDLALHMAKITNNIDFVTLLRNLRDQRPNMIATEKDYILAHLIVLECLMDEENVFKKSIGDNLDVSIYKQQLNYMQRLSWHDAVIESWSVPYNMLNNYLCYPVDGYARHRKFLTTEQPTESTLYTFWKMIIQDNIRTIVLLSRQNVKMWPFRNTESDTVLSVKELKTMQRGSSRKLSVTVFQLPNHLIICEKVVTVLEVNNYDQELYVNNTEEFVQILETLNTNYDTGKQTPILVACSDGITNSGVFVTLDYIIQKCKNEFEADVCNAIRTVRRSGVPFIKTAYEMEFLYRGIIEFLQKDEQYTHIL